ncbi:MAG TPA: type 2 isopentenyl-diphosphate Delta-isomerase [Ktedonobacteraceae bacterium]|jgi:isopentenyl-diphosphate delta-isomerase|nr:type 2 isopentenyl-diphosphate Delta-isomerase [Ktedonobacteraceae bacterium]
MTDEVKQRKIEHVNVALGQDVSAPQRANWNDVQFVHQALPEVNLDEIDTSVTFLGRRLRYPIFISSLTGGHPDVIEINRNLAKAAEHYGLALGVGSQRAAIVNPELVASYAVTREQAPNAFLIANIGAPQLIAQAQHVAFTLEQVQRAVAMIQANALAVHMNSLQEAAQPEGDRNAVGETTVLTYVTKHVGVPVLAKETGAGVNREQAFLLRSCGVSAIDVGGAGGSSMPAIEKARSQARGDERATSIGELYKDWGVPTPIAVVEARTAGLPLIATGGVRNGLDAARALALGATLVGIGFPFLQAASQSYDKVCELLETTIAQLKVAMQLSGANNLTKLREADVVVTGATREWLTLRGFEDELKAIAQRRWQRLQADKA